MTVKRGVGNIKNRLTEEDVMKIYNDSKHTQVSLARKYNVSQSTVNHIRKGRTWVWLTKCSK